MSLRNKIFKKLDSLELIVSPPAIIAQVLALIDKDQSSASKLSEIILKDANLTARVLRVANSSFYGYRQQVTNVNQAIMVLGQNVVRCLVLSISIYNQIASKQTRNEKEFANIWQHLIETAVSAKGAATAAGYKDEDTAYVAGLLHDIGRLFLFQYFSKETFQVRRLMADGLTMTEGERKILDTNHQEVGAYIAKRWDMPEALVEAIAIHHPANERDLEKMSVLSRIIVLADNLSPANSEYPEDLNGAGIKISLLDLAARSLEIDIEKIRKIYKLLPKEVLSNAEGMELNLGDAFEYLSRTNDELFGLYLELAKVFRERQDLSKQILWEERLEGTQESLRIALATLSHYINNATMQISGQCEVAQLLYEQGHKDKVFQKIPVLTESIRSSIRKISAVLEELSGVASVENMNFFKHSRAIDIEEALKRRLEPEKIKA